MQADLSDERLMLAYRAGDADAFTTLYRRYRGSLYRYLAQQCGDPAVAEELYQEVWIKVVKARADYQPLARFSTWVFRIARHRLIDHYRKHSPQALAQLAPNADDQDQVDDLIACLPAPGHETPHALHERHHAAHRINMALAALPPAQREVFLLAEEGGLTLEEIAIATDSGRETTKSRLRYALTKLRHSLQDLL